MNKFSIRLLSVFLTVAILIVSLPLTVFALTSTDTDSGSLVSSDNEYVSNGDITELLELRTADTKYFRLNDGSYYAAMYDTDVHYLDNDGVWQDIDNRLEVCGSEISTSNEKIKFAKKITGNENLFTLHNGNKKLTLSMVGAAKKVEGSITNTDVQFSENETALSKMTTLGNISASVIYEDILSGVDLEYVIRGSDIKENIIVKERSDSYSYAFTMSLNNMNAVLNDGGQIVISDSSDDSVVYLIPAPVMWDAAGCVSSSVYMTLEDHGNGKYTLTVIADGDWINDGERVFPITVDPPIYADPDYPVVDTSISSVNRATSYSSLTYLSVSDTMHSYWKLNKLPSLPRGYYITDAELSFNCISDSESIGYVGLYDVLTDWDSTLTWNKVASTGSPAGKPADDFSDFNLVNGAGTYRWNVTEQVKEWYTDTNYGVMLAPIAGTSCLGTLQFGSNDYASELSRPKLCISYQILRGIEDYWSFTSQGLGFAGSGAVNNAVGNLVYTIPMLTTTDALMPFTPTLVYDSSIRDTDYTYGSIQTSYASKFTAKGYKLNISETLLKKSYISENDVTKYMFIWSDADGTEHYFMPTGTPGTYTDEAGKHLTLIESSNQCTIKDGSDNVRYFSKQSSTPSNAISGWYLTSVEDKNGNKLSFGFDSSNRPTSVKLIPSGDEEIVQLRLSYTTAGYLYAVWNPTSGEGVVLRYSSVRTGSTSASAYNYLRYVVRAHGATTEAQWLAFYNTNSNSSTSVVTVDGVGEYTYGTHGILTAQNHLSRYKVTYDYDTSGRVTSVTESAGVGNTVGQQISLSYGTSSVVIRTSGKDDVFNNADDLITTYGFDKSARVVSCYTTDLDRTQIYGASNGQYVGDENENAKNNLKSSVQTAGQSSNYLLNGGFEATSSGIPYWSSTGLASLDSVMAYSGQKCAELCVNDTIDVSTLYQTVSLPKGEYSLSFKVNTHDSNGLILFVRVEPTILGSDTYVQQDIPVNEYYATGAYAFAGVNFTVTPEDGEVYEDFVVTIGLIGIDTGDVSIWVDDLMLSKTVGAEEYDMLSMGHFESSSSTYTPSSFWSVAYEPDESITVVDSGIPAFGKVLMLDPDVETAEIPMQVVYKATDGMKSDYDYGDYTEDTAKLYTVSGWGKGTGQSYALSSNFALSVEIKYYNGTSTPVYESYSFDFDKGIIDWQFISGGFATNPELGMVDTITVYIMYTDHAGEGYFDSISVVCDSSTTEVYDYNSFGYLTSYQNGSSQSWYQYDDNNNVTCVVSSNKTVTYYTYDSYDRVIYERTKVYDGFFFPSTGTISGTLHSLNETSYSYNDYGQIIETVTSNSVNGAEYVSSISMYDTASGSHIFGVLLTEVDSLDHITRYFYDEDTGRLLATLYPNGNGVAYTYDAVGNLVSVTPAQYSSNDDPYSAVTDSASVTYGYDSVTKMLSSIVTETSTYSFAYDDFGNTSSVSVGNRTLASYEYNDNNGKINTLTYGNGHKVHYVYDTLDRISEIQYNIGSNGAFETVYTYTYDSAGNVYSIRDHRSSEVTMYRYDAQGKLVQSYVYDDYTYLNLYGTSVYYDEQSRVSMVFHNFDYHTSSGTTYDMTYYSYWYNTSNGNIQQLTINGDYISGTVKPVYDGLGRTTSKTVDFDVNNADAFYNKLTYDYVTASNGGESALVSQLISEVRTSTSSKVKSSTTYNYSYDANGNITKITDGEGEVQYKYYYDELGQLIREDNEDLGYSYVYEYDDGGNIIAKKRYAFTTGTLGTVQQTYSYSYGDSSWGDLLTSYNGEDIEYDSIGNPVWIDMQELTWQGRQLASYYDGNYATISYNYNADGILTYKEFYDSDTNELYKHYYTLSGTQIVKEDVSYIDWYGEEGEYTLVYIYDELGSPIGIKYRTPSYAENVYDCYFFEKNLQGDIVAIYNANAVKIATYTYDAWGNFNISVTSSATTAERSMAYRNPFRYRGYYYDTKTGLYYVSSRYYDPEIGRFINADTTDILTATPMGLTDKNLFAYCDNNPVVRVDHGGQFWDTVFDVISLGASIVEVCVNPTDPWAWAGLAGDAIDLIPFVTGVGEVTRAVKTIDKVADTVQIAKAVDFTDDAADIVKTLDRSSGFTKSTASAGRKIHAGYKATDNFSSIGKEYRRINGIRPDYIDFDTRTIYELKPMNPRGVRSGIRQLQKYNKALGGGFNLRLELY